MIAARKFISDLLFIKYLVLRWEINIRKGERDQTREKKQQERRDEMLQGWLEWDGAQRESASGPTSPGTERKGFHGARMALPAPSHPWMQGHRARIVPQVPGGFIPQNPVHQPQQHQWFVPQLPLQPLIPLG